MIVFRDPSPRVVHPPVAGFHHQVEIGPRHRWLVLSGQLGMRPGGQVPEDPVEQLVVALENVRQNLFAADMRVQDVVKLTIYFVGQVDPERWRGALANWLDGHQPAMTAVIVAGLAAPAYRVQVDALAAH